MATIGLCMIVRDVAAIITRCLDSVRRLVDFVMIEDTGSSDGTQDVIRDYIARVGLSGEVVDAPWQDFASNRSAALTRLRHHAEIDYALSIDAGDQIIYDEGFDADAFKAGLDMDLYDVRIRQLGFTFSRALICRNRMNFRYRGVLYEFMEPPPGPLSREAVTGLHIFSSSDGAGSKLADEFQRDTLILEQALAMEREKFLIAHYTFHLAQSCRRSGEIEKALENYLMRAKLGYSRDEVFRSLYAAAQLKEQLSLPEQAVIDAYLAAADAMPTHAEALHGASRFCRIKGRHEEGFQLANKGLAIGRPSDGVVIDWIYDYGLLDELAVTAYWSGHYRESLDACVQASAACPPYQRERIAVNARFALDKLTHGPDLKSEITSRHKAPEMPSDANISLRYHPSGEGVPPPQPIKLQVPGWSGEADKMVDGARPQPWHCRPYTDAATYGLELRFPGPFEYALSWEAGAIVCRRDGILLPNLDGFRFGAFSPNHYGAAFCIDIEVPTGFVLRIEPHPRFYTDGTGNVPAAIPGHIGPHWTNTLFIVFRNPVLNERHVFRPGLPYAQAFLVPDQAKYHAELMSQRDQHVRSTRTNSIKKYGRDIARNVWTDYTGRNVFDDKYKRLFRAFRAGGDALVEKEIAEAEERSREK